jgi:LCP family protein required for cell wall assembly
VPESTPAPPSPVYARGDSRRNVRGDARLKRRQRLVQRLVRIGALCTVILVVVAGSTFGYVEYRNHQIDHVQVGDLTATSPSGIENIVLVGSTSRCALKQQNAAFGLCSDGVTGVNSDVVMILHLNPKTGAASILSIPRDLFVPNARGSAPNKIDAALVDGPEALVDAIQEDFGIPIQHYVELNFDSFQNVVNALGGIKMYFPMPLYDAESSLNIPTAGCHTLNGFQALAVVRARHLQYKPASVKTNNTADWPHDPESDLSRIRRDHEFLRVLAAAVSARGLSNPVTDNDLLGAVAPQLQVDSSFSLSDMLGTVLAFHGVNPNSAPQETMPVIVDVDNYLAGGYDYGSVELTSQPQDLALVDSFLGTAPDRDTMTGKLLPAAHGVTVSVLNGTGITGQAAATGSALSALGLDVVGTGDSPPTGAVTETTVTYSAGHQAAAELIAHDLTGAVVMGLGSTADGADVTVVTGSDFAVVAPSTAGASTPASSGAPAGTASSAAASAPSSDGGVLAPASPATQALAPFDPRACTASGGEGS